MVENKEQMTYLKRIHQEINVCHNTLCLSLIALRSLKKRWIEGESLHNGMLLTHTW